MAEYKAEEILVIEPGSKCVTDSEPFEVKSQLLGTGVLTGIKKVVVGKGITAVRRYAFAGCGELCEVGISEGVAEIGSGAFEGCPNLTEVVIPKSVTKIGEEPFKGCTSLKSHIMVGTKLVFFADAVGDCGIPS